MMTGGKTQAQGHSGHVFRLKKNFSHMRCIPLLVGQNLLSAGLPGFKFI
jgi:hypothetical protein